MGAADLPAQRRLRGWGRLTGARRKQARWALRSVVGGAAEASGVGRGGAAQWQAAVRGGSARLPHSGANIQER
eukprot:10453690-Alexandrium_andersonii.AAC.1